MNGSTQRCVLLMEDSMALAMLLDEVLTRRGFRVVVAGRVSRGVAIACAETIDAAILDINIAGQVVYPVAAELDRRGIPFVFASGYDDGAIAPCYAAWPRLGKPYSMTDVLALVEKMTATPSSVPQHCECLQEPPVDVP